MRAIGLLLAIPAVAWGAGSAYASPKQSSASAPLTSSSGTDLAAGTTICAALAKPIDAKKAKPGQAIAATVTLPVLLHGKVLLANDARIIGHVTLAKTRSRGDAESELAIVFDRAVLKDGSKLPLVLIIQAIGRPSPPALADQDNDDSDLAITRGSPTGSASSPRQTGFPHPRPGEPPQVAHPDTNTLAKRHPVLDASNHGAIGLPDLTLTESADPATGSMVRSFKNDVKLDSGTEIVLRVLGSTGSSGGTTNY
jgi:hypothetical protein